MNDRLFSISRRTVCLGALGSLISAGCSIDTAAGDSRRFFFSRVGSKTGDGSAWVSALPYSMLKRYMRHAEPGTTYVIGFKDTTDLPIAFDRDEISLTASGTPEAPIRIQSGCVTDSGSMVESADGSPGFTMQDPWSIGAVVEKKRSRVFMVLRRGASNVSFEGFTVNGTRANGFIVFSAASGSSQTFSNVVVKGFKCSNLGRLIETNRGSIVDNLTVANCSAVGIVRGFARFRDIRNSRFSDLSLDAALQDGGGGNVCQIISVEAGENLSFENVTLSRAINDSHQGTEKKYVQGDGIVSEEDVDGMFFLNCHTRDMGDSGFDLKAKNCRFKRCSATTSKFGIRIWSESANVIEETKITDPVSRGGTRGACVQAVGTVDLLNCVLQAGSDTAVFSFAGKKPGGVRRIRMTGGSITMTDAARLVAGDRDGHLELTNVVVNGVSQTKTIDFAP